MPSRGREPCTCWRFLGCRSRSWRSLWVSSCGRLVYLVVWLMAVSRWPRSATRFWWDLLASVVRSAVMTLTFCVAAMANRPARPANTLALAGLFTLAWNPFFLFDVGCQLSFLAIGALFWLVPAAQQGLWHLVTWIKSVLSGTPPSLQELEPRLSRWWRTSLNRIGYWFAQGLLTSAVVWLAALPLVAFWFHLVSPIGILLNIPLIFLTNIALLLGAAGMGFAMIWSPLAVLPTVRHAYALAADGGDRPVGCTSVLGPSLRARSIRWNGRGLLLLAAAGHHSRLCRRGPRPLGPRGPAWRITLWCAVLVSTLPGWLLVWPGRSSATLEGDLLAIGHGLAVVLRLPDGRAILYDCGRMGDPRVGRRIIAPALWSFGLDRLDSVYLSHADQDHYNALPDLLDRFRVGEIVIPPGFESDENPGATILLDQVRTPWYSRADDRRTCDLEPRLYAGFVFCIRLRAGTPKLRITLAVWCSTSSTRAGTSCSPVTWINWA